MAGQDLSTDVTFRQDERLEGSQPMEEQGRVRGGRKLSVYQGQHVQRPRKGTSLEHLSNRKASEAVTGPREAGEAGPGGALRVREKSGLHSTG